MTRPNNASPGIPRQGLGQLELVPGLPLMLLCGLDLRGIATRRDLSQEPSVQASVPRCLSSLESASVSWAQ